MSNASKSVIIITLSFFLSIPMAFFMLHVVMDVSTLYHLPFVSDLPRIEIYGYVLLVSIIWGMRNFNLAKDKEREIETSKDSMSELIAKVLTFFVTRALQLLVTWGTAYMMHWLLV